MKSTRNTGYLILTLTAAAATSVIVAFVVSLHPLAEDRGALPMVSHAYDKLLACSQDWRIAAIFLSSLLVLGHGIVAVRALNRTRRHQQKLGLALAILPEFAPTRTVWNFLVKAGAHTRVKVLAASEIFAFCAGITKPVIYISTAAIAKLSEDELEAVLWHEKSHADCRDPLKMALLGVVRATFGYLPALSYSITTFLRGREYDADDEAVRRVGSARAVVRALFKLSMPAALSQGPSAAGYAGFSLSRATRLLEAVDAPEVSTRRLLLRSAATLAILVALPAVSLILTEMAHMGFMAT